MSRSGREAADVVEQAWRRGARFDAWTEHFNEQAWREAADACGIDVAAVAQTSYPTSRIMPWEHVGTGALRTWLVRERDRAEQGLTTPDCTFDHCSACGVCFELHASNKLASVRSGRACEGSASGEGGEAR